MSGSVWTIFFAAARISASSSCRRDVLAIELQRQLAHLLGHRLVVRQEQARGDVGRAHAPGGVHARRQHEADVIAVDRLSRQARDVEQRPQADLVRPLRQQVEPELRDHAVLADERDDVGQRADGGHLDEARQPALVAGAPAQRLHQLQRHADARQVLVGIGAVVPLRVDDRQRRRQLRVRLVVIRDDQVDAELARAAGPRRRRGCRSPPTRPARRRRRAAARSRPAAGRSRPSAARE